MKSIYQAANITDAKLVQHLLEEQSIAAFINGEYLQGALGELPLNNALRVEVADEDAPRAREIVRDWDAAKPEYDASEGEEAPQGSPATRRAGLGAFGKIGWLLCGALLASGATWAWLTRKTQGPDIDYDKDGIVDERLHFESDRVTEIEIDRNKDRKFDQVLYSGGDGRLLRVESDQNFDGIMDTEDLYESGIVAQSREDRNHDGKPEYRVEFLSGVIFRETWFDAAGNTIKRVIYRDALPAEGEFDSNGDGQLDTWRKYDARGEIVESRHAP